MIGVLAHAGKCQSQSQFARARISVSKSFAVLVGLSCAVLDFCDASLGLSLACRVLLLTSTGLSWQPPGPSAFSRSLPASSGPLLASPGLSSLGLSYASLVPLFCLSFASRLPLLGSPSLSCAASGFSWPLQRLSWPLLNLSWAPPGISWPLLAFAGSAGAIVGLSGHLLASPGLLLASPGAILSLLAFSGPS